MRAFVAIELPERLKDALRGVQAQLDRGFDGVSWTRPEGMHLTLKFLGEADDSKVEEISACLEKAGSGIKPFTLSVTSVAGFPNLKNPRVLWAGITEDPELSRLQGNIEDGLEKAGFEKENRPFQPHLTVCRIKSPSASRALGRLAGELKPDISLDFKVDNFVLFRSVLRPRGAEYTALRRIALKG